MHRQVEREHLAEGGEAVEPDVGPQQDGEDSEDVDWGCAEPG